MYAFTAPEVLPAGEGCAYEEAQNHKAAGKNKKGGYDDITCVMLRTACLTHPIAH